MSDADQDAEVRKLYRKLRECEADLRSAREERDALFAKLIGNHTCPACGTVYSGVK